MRKQDEVSLWKLRKRLAAIPEDVKAAVAPTILKQANILANDMRRLAPDDPATGAPDLKTSIAVTGPGQKTPPYSQPGGSMVVGENEAAVTVGNSEVRYPHLLEYGTTKMNAQPFFWPAVRSNQKKIRQAIKRSITRAIRKSKS